MSIEPSGEKRDIIQSLPPEMLDKIMDKCNDKDLVALLSVSTNWKKIASQETLRRYLTKIFQSKLNSRHKGLVITIIDEVATHIFRKETHAHHFHKLLKHQAEHYLEKLDLTKLTPLEIKKLVKNLPPQCATLHGIDLSGIRVDDQTLLALLEKCPHLQELNLNDCGLLTSKSLTKIGEFCPQLQVLKMGRTSNLSSQEMIQMIQGMSNLKEVDLSNSAADENFMDQLTQDNPNLTKINAFFCSEFNDKCLEFLTERSLELKEIDITKCTNISDAGVDKLTQNLKKVQRMVLTYCAGLTSDAIQRAKAAFPLASIEHSPL